MILFIHNLQLWKQDLGGLFFWPWLLEWSHFEPLIVYQMNIPYTLFQVQCTYLVGGFNPFEKYESNWESSPCRGENKKSLKPPTRYVIESYIYIYIKREREREWEYNIPMYTRHTCKAVTSNVGKWLVYKGVVNKVSLLPEVINKGGSK